MDMLLDTALLINRDLKYLTDFACSQADYILVLRIVIGSGCSDACITQVETSEDGQRHSDESIGPR